MLSSRLGIWSIPLATSIANIVGVVLLYIQLRPLAGRLDERELVRALVRIAVATALSAGVAYGVWWGLDALLGEFVLVQFVTLGAALAASVVVYVLAAKVMAIEELNDVLMVGRAAAGRAGDLSTAVSLPRLGSGAVPHP